MDLISISLLLFGLLTAIIVGWALIIVHSGDDKDD